MATYYISTSDGRVHQIDGVTGCELVVNDGVATVVYDGVWRNVLMFPAAVSGANTTYGPGWSVTPAKFDRDSGTGNLLWTPTSGDTTQPTIFQDDILQETAPRHLEIKKSYWKFTTADGDFFFPMEVVVGMSNNAPTY
jgi:hypothetical protein